MRLLAVLAVIGIIGAFSVLGGGAAPAHAQYATPEEVCIDLSLDVETNGGSLTAIIENGSGGPVEGALVTFYSNGSAIGSALTDVNGEATIPYDPTGDETLSARLDGETTDACSLDFEQAVESAVEEVAALPATGSGGIFSNSSTAWTPALLATFAIVALAAMARKATSR